MHASTISVQHVYTVLIAVSCLFVNRITTHVMKLVFMEFDIDYIRSTEELIKCQNVSVTVGVIRVGVGVSAFYVPRKRHCADFNAVKVCTVSRVVQLPVEHAISICELRDCVQRDGVQWSHVVLKLL